MADDLHDRLHAALAAERDAERNVTKIRERISVANGAAERARAERQRAAERVVNGEEVNLGTVIQKLMHAEAEAELLTESVTMVEQRLAEARAATESVLTGFARQRAGAAQKVYESAGAAFKAAAKANEVAFHALNAATRLTSADGQTLRMVFNDELKLAAV